MVLLVWVFSLPHTLRTWRRWNVSSRWRSHCRPWRGPRTEGPSHHRGQAVWRGSSPPTSILGLKLSNRRRGQPQPCFERRPFWWGPTGHEGPLHYGVFGSSLSVVSEQSSSSVPDLSRFFLDETSVYFSTRCRQQQTCRLRLQNNWSKIRLAADFFMIMSVRSEFVG